MNNLLFCFRQRSSCNVRLRRFGVKCEAAGLRKRRGAVSGESKIEPVEEIVRERLLEHVPHELAAAYNFIDAGTLREAVARYDCILDEHQRQSGVVQFTPRRVSRR